MVKGTQDVVVDKNKQPIIDKERARIYKALQNELMVWCSECCEFHYPKVKYKVLDHCLESECGHIIVLPYKELFANVK